MNRFNLQVSYFKFRGSQRTLDTLARPWAYKYVAHTLSDQCWTSLSLPNSYIYLFLIYILTYILYTSLSPERREEKETEAESEKRRGREREQRREKRSRRRGKSNQEDLHPRSSSEFFGSRTRNPEYLNSHTIDIWCLYMHVMKIG